LQNLNVLPDSSGISSLAPDLELLVDDDLGYREVVDKGDLGQSFVVDFVIVARLSSLAGFGGHMGTPFKK
jgi:hypothetical protein